jgi:orotidine-5'-phosphate decarboxylase
MDKVTAQPHAHKDSVAAHKQAQSTGAKTGESSVRTDAKERLIVALDFPSADKAMDLVDRLDGCCRWFKVGMELYYAAGNRVIEELRKRGYEVFLDLKLHDIPNTVAGAVRSVAEVGASLLTVHAGGGEQMMHAAVQAARAPGAPKLLAVTVLTSMDATELRTVGVGGAHGSAANALHTQVLRLARLARSSGIDGLVCSAEEVEAVRAAMGPEILLVVPGIRPAGAAGRRDDQRRVASATEAIARGASMLVVGRPIAESANPAKVAAGILAEIAGAQ